MIPVVFISDENFIMQTHIAMKSLIMNKNPDTEYDIFVVMAECSEAKKKELSVLASDQIHVNFVEASLEEFRDIKQLAHIPIACLLKFKICDFVKDYDKLIYLDGDIIVRGDLTKLYEIDLGDAYAAAVPSLENIHNGEKRYNAGVMLFHAKKMRENAMSQKLISYRKGLGDRGSMDQQTFNLVMGDEMKELPCQYNCIPYKLIGGEKKKYPIKELNLLFHTSYENSKQMVDNAVIIHYATGGKPWKYTYIACGQEWYAYYKASMYGNIKLKRDNKLQAHMKGFVRVVKQKGIKGIVNRLQDYIKKENNISGNWG